jgi:acetoin utilization protein AcuC
LRENNAVLVGSDLHLRPGFGGHHPLAIPRLATVMRLCALLGWLDDASFRTCTAATEDELEAFHERRYVRALREADRAGRVEPAARAEFGIGTMENPLFPGVFERAATAVGGSILAARLAARGCVAFHPAGGTHHGRRERAAGFCYFNDPVFAILELRRLGMARVLYVDLDAHHGDGVQAAFAADPTVLMVSIHEQGRWPYSGRAEDDGGGSAVNLPVPAGFHDDELDCLMQEVVLPVGKRFSPGAVVVTCGTDGLEGDPLTAMALTNVALWRAVESVAALAPAAVVLGGGGYNPWTLARCWTGLWGRLRGCEVPVELPGACRELLAGLSCDLVEDEDVRPEWLTTLADTPRVRPVRAEIRELTRRWSA